MNDNKYIIDIANKLIDDYNSGYIIYCNKKYIDFHEFSKILFNKYYDNKDIYKTMASHTVFSYNKNLYNLLYRNINYKIITNKKINNRIYNYLILKL